MHTTILTITCGALLLAADHAASAGSPEQSPVRLDIAAAIAAEPAPASSPFSPSSLDDTALAIDLASLGALGDDAPAEQLLPAVAGLAPQADDSGAKADEWWFTPTFSLWMPGLSGDIGVRRLTVSVSASIIDVIEDSDSIIGIMGALQAGKGKIGGYVSGAYMKIGADAGPNNRIDVTNEISLLNFGVSYEIGRWAMENTATADHPARDLTLVLTAGGRYSDISVDLDFDVLPNRSRSESWVDPMVGALVSVPLSQHWSLVGRGEVGGFGVASDFAWTAMGLVSWDFYIKDFPSALQFGYLAVGDDYTTGSGRDRFEWDVVLHGLLLNFTMRF